MKKFSKWLTEAVSSSSIETVSKIIQSYLSKKLGGKLYQIPGVEEYTNSTGHGWGVRYVYSGAKSIRFNWKSSSINSMNLDSVDLWDGTSRDPQWNLAFDKQTSLVKILPAIIDFISKPFASGVFYAVPSDSVNEELIIESTAGDIDPFELVMKELKPDTKVPVVQIHTNYGQGVSKIVGYLRATHPYSELFSKEGRGVTFIGTNDDIKALRSARDTVMSALGATKVTVSKGGSKETYAPTTAENEIEAKGGIEKVAYEVQLKHLAVLMKLIIKGASNALFVAGRGGTGKTQTVETELAKAGLQDGDGYFKNTGSASPYGIYTSLFRNRTGIVLFDDCDSALADQEGRNLIKAATDTKKVRKMAWNKKSSIMIPEKDYLELSNNYADPVYDDKGNQFYPSSFEFVGRVIFISNLALNKLDPDGAIRTRGYIIEINPTDAEMVDYMAKIAPNIRLESGRTLSQSAIDEVVAEIRNSKNKNDISLRKLVRGMNIRDEMGNDPMWKDILRLYA